MRSVATMATPPQSFQLDRSLFNGSLYSEIRNFWYDGLPVEATAPTLDLLKKWWGFNRTEEEKEVFDGECRTRFGPALESIGPAKLSLPPFKSYEEDIEHASTLAAPFLAEVKNAQQEDEKKGADTLLSLILLLDQMPRNIHRDQEGLRLVWGHYDRLVSSLLRSSLALSPSPVRHPSWKGMSQKTWILLPFVHTEHLPSHSLWAQLIAELKTECEEAKDEPALVLVANAQKAEAEHLEPLERFGRYPHRNECLGRNNTPEEDEFMKTAKTFGVKQVKKQEAKDEL